MKMIKRFLKIHLYLFIFLYIILIIFPKLSGELDKLLNIKVEEKGFEISVEGKGVVSAVVELLHSQNVRY